MSIIPETITPEELAEQIGWSARFVRETARALNACLGRGRGMRLTKADVEKIQTAASNPEFWRRESLVYFIESLGFIKIGWTANWRKRLANIQAANPEPLRVLLIVGRPKVYEKTMHAKFAQHRANGEWFKDHPDIRTFIAEHQNECWYRVRRVQ